MNQGGKKGGSQAFESPRGGGFLFNLIKIKKIIRFFSEDCFSLHLRNFVVVGHWCRFKKYIQINKDFQFSDSPCQNPDETNSSRTTVLHTGFTFYFDFLLFYFKQVGVN